jgi:hypothetical protein
LHSRRSRISQLLGFLLQGLAARVQALGGFIQFAFFGDFQLNHLLTEAHKCA